MKQLQAMKTGALLRFACLAGAILGEATPAQREALDRYGAALGQAFQIADDLLDVEGDAATVGKADRQGRGGRQGHHRQRARARSAPRRGSRRWSAKPKRRSAPFGRDGEILKMAARFVAERKA